MLKLDGHIHSKYSSDSIAKISDIIESATRKNLDIIAISDHNTVEGSKVAIENNKDNEDLLIIPSIEISSKYGHILGLGCSEIVEKGLTSEETIDKIHDQGGIAVIPHPFCFYRHGLLHKLDSHRMKFDAIETKNARYIVGYCNRKAKKLSEKNNIPGMGSSDAHFPKFIGDCYSEIECEKDIDSVLKAIRKGKVKACGKGTSNIQLLNYLINKKVLKKYE